MKKIKLVLLASIATTIAFGQTASYKKRPSLGVSFSMKDFTTPALIKATSFSDVLKDNKWTKLSKMTPSLTVQYFEGLTENIDFMAGATGCFLQYPFQPNTASTDLQDRFLLELDANLNFKLLSDKYFLVPYISTGLGASMFNASNFAAYFPIGAGLQFNLGSETFLNVQYNNNVAVTDNSTTNFNYRIGFASPLKEKDAPVTIAPPPPPPPVAVVEEKDTDGDVMKDSLREEIKRVLKSLSPREAEIVNAYFGLNNDGTTIEQIGMKYDLTKERIRQIKERAIKRLQKARYSNALKAYLG